jgi:hypothetical protein
MKTGDQPLELIRRCVDGDAAPEDIAALQIALRQDAALRRTYARYAHLDAALGDGRLAAARPAVAEGTLGASRTQPSSRWLSWRPLAAAAALLAAGFIVFLLTPSPAAAALSQMIAALDRALDRTYTISVLEGDAWQPLKDGRQIGYEGARLHLRGRSQFVLQRPLDSGNEAITGSDGQSNWDIRGKGPVRITSDLNRFRGGLPGEYQNVPFLDLSSLLHSLAADYDLTLADVSYDPSLKRLTADKRNREKRGLPRMEFIFRKDSGIVVKMELRGLPREKGGPRAVALTLTGESSLPSDFFNHAAHHELEREVIVEPAGFKP